MVDLSIERKAKGEKKVVAGLGGDASNEPARPESFRAVKDRLYSRIEGLDIAPDLGADIGSRRWFRGLGTFVGLSVVALAFWPDFAPLEAAPPLPDDQQVRSEYRSQMIMPLGLGADTGRRMGPTALVRPLAEAPERPQMQMLATLGRGDSLDRTLRRAGIGSAEADEVASLIGRAVPLDELDPGTQIDITLGRRPAPGATRPLERLSFRARFDLELKVDRMDGDGPLSLTRRIIRVDETPLRIRGTVGDSLYRSARAAGAPASAVQAYLKALGTQVNLQRDVRATDTFDMIVSHRRAATGERQAGQLLFAGLERGSRGSVQLMRWGSDGDFFDADGTGEEKGGLVAPVPGSMSSRYGMRRHPVLGYRRMHAGVDFRARHGTPIVAVTDGRVTGAGRMGGCGNAVRLRHANGIDTRYCHMSRIAVRRGASVRRGQVIGYVGSTGLSTGPHLHYEMYRGGKHVNPASVSFVTRKQLSREELTRFRDALGTLRDVEEGAALADLTPTADEVASEEPEREIDKLDKPRPVG
ncbi:M23 family metallopeptidase [Erythrobacter sp. SD-21]|uniref:M23 family metallopeptidase n=1 Tax=Erythrobacter sp. SD-21 TaxID=161528 RepID=UPI000153F17D|nr:M23 family metallopeptidase [Erythrobacter sp. SD-21]EDL49829.1 membrane protein [Erythrobacter sp. SD-21]